jgi:hypothetical protein
MLPTGNIIKSRELCEKRVTECCRVVQSTAIAMGVVPFLDNDFSNLQLNYQTPKAGVTGSTNCYAIGDAAATAAKPAG